MDHSLPGSCVHGILQAGILEGVATPPPGDLPDLGTEPTTLASPALAGRFFTTRATWEAPCAHICIYKNTHNSCFFNMYIYITFHVHKSIPSLFVQLYYIPDSSSGSLMGRHLCCLQFFAGV